MTEFNTIFLNNNWHCFDPDALVAEDDAPYQLIDDIARWMGVENTIDGGQLMLRHTFRLDAVDYCVGYVLKIRAAPPKTAVYIGDAMNYIGEIHAHIPFTHDVTHLVHLDDNTLTLIVSEAGAFGSIELQAVPCD